MASGTSRLVLVPHEVVCVCGTPGPSWSNRPAPTNTPGARPAPGLLVLRFSFLVKTSVLSTLCTDIAHLCSSHTDLPVPWTHLPPPRLPIFHNSVVTPPSLQDKLSNTMPVSYHWCHCAFIPVGLSPYLSPLRL